MGQFSGCLEVGGKLFAVCGWNGSKPVTFKASPGAASGGTLPTWAAYARRRICIGADMKDGCKTTRSVLSGELRPLAFPQCIAA
jgi:hypothetical protein